MHLVQARKSVTKFKISNIQMSACDGSLSEPACAAGKAHPPACAFSSAAIMGREGLSGLHFGGDSHSLRDQVTVDTTA